MPLILTKLLAISASVATAAAAPATRQPTERWAVNFDDAQCLASRAYGDANDPLYLTLKAPAIGDVMQISVLRHGNGLAEQTGASVQINEQPRIRTSMLIVSPPGTKLRAYQLNLRSADAAFGPGATSLNIRSSSFDETFSLSEMGALLKVMDRCVSDLKQVWNVAEPSGDRSSLPLRARAQANLASYVTHDDYPAAALRNELSGTVKFVLLVNEQGRVADCTLLEPSGVAALDGQTCAIMKKRARFDPARDRDGKPVKDAVTSWIKWRIAGASD